MVTALLFFKCSCTMSAKSLTPRDILPQVKSVNSKPYLYVFNIYSCPGIIFTSFFAGLRPAQKLVSESHLYHIPSHISYQIFYHISYQVSHHIMYNNRYHIITYIIIYTTYILTCVWIFVMKTRDT